ncbi:MAG: Hsp20/alpha crystallin family protein [Polyangiaceae bacterium]
MLARFNDFDSTLSVFDSLFEGFGYRAAHAQDWRRLRVEETKDALLVTLDVPGMNEKDIGVELHEGILTIRGARKTESPAEERIARAAGLKFEKSFSLPYEVDPETSAAAVKDGVLTLTLPKVAAAKPKAIAVSASK